VDEPDFCAQNTQNIVGATTISLPEPVYERLRAEKRDDESFGDVIERLIGGRSLEAFWGGPGEETAREAREAVAEGRERSDHRLSELL
jgi:predicted CopG family antitoxin